jgi:hypothetical protein
MRTGSIPAYLVPLIELSPGRLTAPEVTVRMKALLEGIGKVPVVCAARPGFIVPANPDAGDERSRPHGGEGSPRRKISTRP